MEDKRGREKIAEIPVEKHTTAAWANISVTKPLSNVAIPDEIEVGNAKEWVDTNQK